MTGSRTLGVEGLTRSSLSRFSSVALCCFNVASPVCCFSSESDSDMSELKQRHRNSDVTERLCGRVETHLTLSSSVPERGRREHFKEGVKSAVRT